MLLSQKTNEASSCDDNGNILSVSDGTNKTTYVYDSANQLIREENEAGGFIYVWTYDNGGNILSRTKYKYDDGVQGAKEGTVEYAYTHATWKDLLKVYDGRTIVYDNIGNPIREVDASDNRYRTYTWEHGRQLKTLYTNNDTVEDTTDDRTWEFEYNADGLRISRSDDTTTYKYQYLDGQLVMMEVGEVSLYFNYDASGTPLSIVYNRPTSSGADTRESTTYYYVTNLQGDVVGIVNQSGNQIVGYTYDAWGNIIDETSTGTIGGVLKGLNPLRYRGYVYDTETGLYYLQSRYYDPELGRFINADALVATGQGILGNNMFAYCNNNPAMFKDHSGNRPTWLEGSLGGSTVYSDTATSMNLYVDEWMVLYGVKDCYKDVTVHNVLPKGYGFSYGDIFIGVDKSPDFSDVNLLRHEYGHTRQLDERGYLVYSITTVVPSFTCAALKEIGMLKDVHYYSLPWEFEAEILGNVKGRVGYDSNVLEKCDLYRKAVSIFMEMIYDE